MKKKIHKLLRQAAAALESEIETVREKPSTDILFNGQKTKTAPADFTDYSFECHQPSIRFAEEIKATIEGKSYTIHPVLFEDKQVVLRFPDEVGSVISEVHLEWENDFVLKRTLSEIMNLEDAKDGVNDRLERLFNPDESAIPFDGNIIEDGHRNEAQYDAIQKAMSRRTLYIWGPPGTGKTDTLGYIIANYLLDGKRVLFASNTNRAVDVGLLSTLNALNIAGASMSPMQITRFGDAALPDPALEPHLFDTQMEKTIDRRKSEAGEWVDLLSRREQALKAVEKRMRNGKQMTNKQELELS